MEDPRSSEIATGPTSKLPIPASEYLGHGDLRFRKVGLDLEGTLERLEGLSGPLLSRVLSSEIEMELRVGGVPPNARFEGGEPLTASAKLAETIEEHLRTVALSFPREKKRQVVMGAHVLRVDPECFLECLSRPPALPNFHEAHAEVVPSLSVFRRELQELSEGRKRVLGLILLVPDVPEHEVGRDMRGSALGELKEPAFRLGVPVHRQV